MARGASSPNRWYKRVLHYSLWSLRLSTGFALINMSSSLIVVVAALLWCTSGSTKEILELLNLMPYYSKSNPSLVPSWPDGDNIFPALKLAQDQINNDPTILQNYTLELIQGRSYCQFTSLTIASFVKETFANRSRRVVGVLGPGCSSSSLALAPVTNRSEITLVMVHNSGAVALTDRKKYWYHLGNLGTTDNFVRAMIVLMTKWDRVAVLYDEARQYYLHIKEGFIKKLNSSTVKYLFPVSLEFIPLQAIRERKLRVVLIMCPSELTRRIICLSWRENMTYGNYQYVYNSHTEDDLVQNVTFRYNKKDIMCSEREMARALANNIILVNSFKTSVKGVLRPLNATYTTFLTQYKEYRDSYNTLNQYLGAESTFSSWTGYFYDSLWAWALVLDNLTRTDPQFIDPSSNIYGNKTKAGMIMEQFYKIEFEGVSGHFSFERATGFTPRTIDVIQIDDTMAKRLWQINITGRYGQAPYQIPSSFPLARENEHLARFTALVVIAIFILIAVMQAFTYKYRDTAAIKATTPKLLHLSYCGVYIMIMGLFVFIMFSAFPLSLDLKEEFCQLLWTWTLPIGFTLSLGPVCMRTWRVYRIFIHYQNPGPFISTAVLLTGVFIMLLLDVVLAAIWTTLEEIRGSLHEFTFTNPGGKQDQCTSNWLFLIVLANKAILLLCVTTLAFLTKGIKKLSFTTSSLRVLVYITAAISTLGISLTLIFSSPKFHPNYKFVTLTTTIISLSISFIVCVFLPPLLPTLKPIAEEHRSELSRRFSGK